jgi:hypothetical protein
VIEQDAQDGDGAPAIEGRDVVGVARLQSSGSSYAKQLAVSLALP